MIFFNGKDLCNSINPDEAVAFGAAVQAELLSDGIKNVPSLVLIDVTPLSLGNRGDHGRMWVVIPKNTIIPVKKTSTCETAIDNQTIVMIRVYEGERKRATDNNLLGSFKLSGIPTAPRGHPIRVSFSIDESGILAVCAKEASTGIMNEIVITNYKERLSAEEIQKLIREADIYSAEDKKFQEMAEVKSKLENCVYKLETVFKKQEVKLKLSKLKNLQINAAIRRGKILLHENHRLEIDVLKNHMNKLDSMYLDIIL